MPHSTKIGYITDVLPSLVQLMLCSKGQNINAFVGTETMSVMIVVL